MGLYGLRREIYSFLLLPYSPAARPGSLPVCLAELSSRIAELLRSSVLVVPLAGIPERFWVQNFYGDRHYLQCFATGILLI